jgi:Na+/H+-dicarboxylate symporter
MIGSGNVLQVLLVSILFAVAIKALGERGAPIVRAKIMREVTARERRVFGYHGTVRPPSA